MVLDEASLSALRTFEFSITDPPKSTQSVKLMVQPSRLNLLAYDEPLGGEGESVVVCVNRVMSVSSDQKMVILNRKSDSDSPRIGLADVRSHVRLGVCLNLTLE